MNDYENFEKGMIYMKILKKGGVVEKRGGGGNEIHAPCACGRQGLPLATAKVIIGKSDENHMS